jgi:CHAD domain-containing protein
LHDWRIATRRLLAAEFLWASGNEATAKSSVRALTRDAFRAAGRLRDTEVCIGLAASLAGRFVAAAAMARWLRESLPRRRQRAARKLGRVDVRQVRAATESWRVNGHAERRALRAGQQCARALARMTPRSDLAELHRVRVRLKTLRYILELRPLATAEASPALPLRKLIALQKRLGTIADDSVLVRAMERFVEEQPARRQELLSLHRHVARRQARRVQRFLAERGLS